MAIHSFLKIEKGDPDWQFTPERYFGKEFKLIDANTMEINQGQTDVMVLRQNPTEKELLAKHLKIHVKPESKLDLLVLNDSDSKLQQIFLYDIHIEEGGSLNFGIFVKGGKFNKHIVQVYLEEGGEFNAYGLMVNTTGGDTEIITKVIHQNVETISNQLILGMAGKNSQTVFQGMTVLSEGSNGSEATVEGRNLIVGEHGRCHSKPDVFVDCDEVSASYGSDTAHLDQEKLFYLQSRGLDLKQATDIAINSFQNQVINIIPYSDLKQEVIQLYQI